MARRDTPSVEEKPANLKRFDDFELRLGDMMRGERATLGKSLLDVQRDLKIKAAYIAAIENSDPTAFETQGFVAGYVRSYARYLGMDPEAAFKAFCGESGFQTTNGMAAGTSGSAKKAKSQTVPTKGNADPLIASKTPYLPAAAGRFSEIEPRAIASIAVLLALFGAIGIGAYSVLQEIQRVNIAPVAQTPGVVSTVDPLAIVGAATDNTVDVELGGDQVAALDRLYQPQALELPVMVERDGPIGAVDPNSVGALAPFPTAIVEQPPTVDAASIENALAEAVEEEQPLQVVENTPVPVVLFAVRPAWVRVQSAQGNVLFEKILDAGEKYTIPTSEEPALLRAGNAGSVYFLVDGQTYGPAGDGASVAKNVALGSEGLMAAYTAADIESDPTLKRIAELVAVDDNSSE